MPNPPYTTYLPQVSVPPRPPAPQGPLTPPMNPPNYTPQSTPYGVPQTPGPFATPPRPPNAPATPTAPAYGGYGAEPPGYQGGGLPPVNNPYAPPAAAGGGGGGDLWNGMRILQRGPGGNVLVDYNGVPTAFDQWGNLIPHLGAGYNSADPNAGAAPQGPAAPETGGLTPGLPTPPSQAPNTFYSPTTGSPYLQFQGNFLSYFDDPSRAQFIDTLRKAGFKDTGAYNTYGPSDFIRPAQFDQNDLNGLFQDENLREWMRWWLGWKGYGLSYQLPAGYQPGSGLPTPPPVPQV